MLDPFNYLKSGWDFFVLEIGEDVDSTIRQKLIVEKLPFTTDAYGLKEVNGGKALPTLERYLELADVEDSAIGAVIEQLEALPYGAKHAYAVGRNGRILIEQRG